MIAEEIIDAIASPAYIAQCGALLGVPNIVDQHLIHLEEPFRPRPTWGNWFASAGVPYVDNGTGLRLNDYALVLQAAMAGEGIALGWRHVTERLIQQRMLCRACKHAFASGQGFYIIWSDSHELSQTVTAVRDWVIESARTPRSK